MLFPQQQPPSKAAEQPEPGPFAKNQLPCEPVDCCGRPRGDVGFYALMIAGQRTIYKLRIRPSLLPHMVFGKLVRCGRDTGSAWMCCCMCVRVL